MMFEWDEAKNRQNIARHGLRLEDARKIFEGFTVDRIDDRFDRGSYRQRRCVQDYFRAPGKK